MNRNKWWNRALIASLIIHLGILAWIAWVDPFAPKPTPQDEYLDLELVDISDLPPIQSSSANADTADAQAIPKPEFREPTAPQPIMPVSKIVSPEEAAESAPVVRPSASGGSASSSSGAKGSAGTSAGTSSGSGTAAGGSSTVDLSCGPVIVSRGTAVCKTPLRRTAKVKVRITIGTDGAVHKAIVASSSGNDGADKAAVEAAYNYTFRPAQDKRGNPITSGGVILVTVQPNR